MFPVARKLVLVVATAAALAAAGVAVARSVDDDNGKSASRVAATFTATTASTQAQTCTTADGHTIVTTKAKYAGSATGSADLTGPITLSARSVVNTTDNVGLVDGSFKIATSAGKTDAEFTAVYDGGAIAGLAEGHTATHGQLVANISAGLGAGGFSSGKLGGGTAGGSAVELGPGGCTSKTKTAKREAEGTVSAVSSTSVTVAGLTCTVPANLASTVGNFKVGDRAEIKCALSGSTSTLTKIDREDD